MSAMIDAAAAAWWSWSVSMALQLTVLVMLLAGVERLFSSRLPPRLRLLLWSLLVLKLVLPPDLGFGPHPLGGAVAALPGVPKDSVSPPASGAPAGWFLWWLAGVAILGAASLYRHRSGVRRLLDPAARLPLPSALEALAAEVAAELRLRRSPPVILSRSLSGPAVVGVLRPRVLLPEVLASADAETLRCVLRHELAHVRRRDPWLALLAHLVQILYWYHPLVWVVRRRLALLRELCCDEVAARPEHGGAQAYRRCLLRLCRHLAEGPVPGLAFITPRSQLLARLDALARPARAVGFRGRLLAASLGLLLVSCLPMGGTRSAPPAAISSGVPVRSAAELEALPGCLARRYLVFGMLGPSGADAPR